MRQRVVHQRRSQQLPTLVIRHPLKQRPTEALHYPAVNLSLHLRRVNGATNILRRNVVEHAHLARLRINGYLCQVRGEHRRGDTISRAATTKDRFVGSAKAHRVRGDLLQCNKLLRHPFDHHLSIPQLHIVGGRLQHFSRNSESLGTRVTCRRQYR